MLPVSAVPTLAAATANTESFGSTLNGMVKLAALRPGDVAVTEILVGARAVPTRMVDERDVTLLPASRLTLARSARSELVPEASTVTRTMALAKPWYAERQLACEGS